MTHLILYAIDNRIIRDQLDEMHFYEFAAHSMHDHSIRS